MKTKILLPVVIAIGLIMAGGLNAQDGPTIRKSKDGYTVRVNKPGLVWVNVYMERNGKQYFIGQKPFRVRYLPSPYPAIAGKRGGKINKNFLLEVGKVSAILDNVNFDINYQITGFKFNASDGLFSKPQACSGNKFDEKILKIIKNLDRGDKVYFENIKAVGPDKISRDIGSLVFSID